MRAAHKAVAGVREFRLEDRREHLMQRLLDQPIRQRRNADCPHPALRLGDIHPAHCLRNVRPRQQFGLDRRPVLPEMILELGHANAIDTGRPFVPHHPLVRKHQVAASAHGVHQPAFLRLLRFRPRQGRRLSLGTRHGSRSVPHCFFRFGIRFARIFRLRRHAPCSRRLLAVFNVRPFGSS